MLVNTRKQGVERLKLTTRERMLLQAANRLLADIAVNCGDLQADADKASSEIEIVLEKLNNPKLELFS